MTEITLGRSGIKVPPICFGSLTMSPCQYNFEAERAGEVIAYAAEKRLNFIDTAQYYRNYHLLRAAVKKSKKDLIITSKTYAYEYQAAVEAVEEARREIDRDYIDIFMLHEQESEWTLRGHRDALDALYDLKAKGIIRAVGISTHFVAGVKGAVKYGLDVVHPMLNVTGLGICDGSREDMEKAVHKAYESGMGVYTMKAFGGGNLYMRASECLDYIFDFPYKHSVALGMKSEQEVDDNLEYFCNRKFTEGYNVQGKHLHIEDYCTGCGRCAEKCSQKALYIEDGRCNCRTYVCLLCGYCAAACPDFAIKIL